MREAYEPYERTGRNLISYLDFHQGGSQYPPSTLLESLAVELVTLMSRMTYMLLSFAIIGSSLSLSFCEISTVLWLG